MSQDERRQETLTLNLPDGASGPLQDLVEAVDGGIGEVLAALRANGGTIEVPGLGEISIGFDKQRARRQYAVAGSHVLKVLLYGTDTVKGSGDDSLVSIGRSWARITRDLPAGVMRGGGWGADAKVVDGVARVGRLDRGQRRRPHVRSSADPRRHRSGQRRAAGGDRGSRGRRHRLLRPRQEQARGRVAAVVIEFAPGSPGATELRLGLARAFIKGR